MSKFPEDWDVSALFSRCGRYRYRLRRHWEPGTMNVMFLMLNPSTADEHKNDPTVERCQRYAQAWGYGGIVVCNLFAYRATKRKDMLKFAEPVGPENDLHILNEAQYAGVVVCAWGNEGAHLGRSQQVVKMLRDNKVPLHYLILTKAGEPGHPLYLKKDLQPIPWEA